MAEISNELIYEVLKQVQERGTITDLKVDELKAEMNAVRGHLIAMQQDIHNIYTILGNHSVWLERTERRLGLIDERAPV